MPKYYKKVTITFNDGTIVDLVWYENGRLDARPVSYFMNGRYLSNEREVSAELVIENAHRDKLNICIWD